MKINDQRAFLQAMTFSDVINFYLDLGYIHIKTKIENSLGNKMKALELVKIGETLVFNFSYKAEFIQYRWGSEVFIRQNPCYEYLVYRGAMEARYDKYVKSQS